MRTIATLQSRRYCQLSVTVNIAQKQDATASLDQAPSKDLLHQAEQGPTPALPSCTRLSTLQKYTKHMKNNHHQMSQYCQPHYG